MGCGDGVAPRREAVAPGPGGTPSDEGVRIQTVCISRPEAITQVSARRFARLCAGLQRSIF